MAVGDVVSQVSSSAGANFTFQPASGVQVCITQFITSSAYNDMIQGRGNINTTNALQITQGSSSSGNQHIANWSAVSHKFFVDNSSYLYFDGYSGSYAGFSGIQTA